MEFCPLVDVSHSVLSNTILWSRLDSQSSLTGYPSEPSIQTHADPWWVSVTTK